MKICLKYQSDLDMTLPPLPVNVYTGSALPLELVGIPSEMSGGKVIGVRVSITNADGQNLVAECTPVGCDWYTLFAAAGFSRFGVVKQGVRFCASIKRLDGSTAEVILAVADFEVKPASPQAQPGDPTRGFVIKGDDVYLKSYLAEDIQHYVKQGMEYDPEIGWGAVWSGDYILSDSGEFVPYEEVR